MRGDIIDYVNAVNKHQDERAAPALRDYLGQDKGKSRVRGSDAEKTKKKHRLPGLKRDYKIKKQSGIKKLFS